MSWFTLFKWEWFKLRGRRVVWSLLAILVVFSAAIVFVRFGDYQFLKDRDVNDEIIFKPGAPEIDNFEVALNCTEFLAGVPITEVPDPFTLDDIDQEGTAVKCRKEEGEIRTRLSRLSDAFTLPGSIGKALRWTGLLSIPFLAFLTVLVVGSEYGWGTLRTALMKGVGRWRLLSVKLALVALIMAGLWALILVTIIGSSLIATAAASGVGHGEWTAGVTGEVIRDWGRAWFAGVPYIALAALLAIVFSRWAGGMLAATGVAVGYFFFELFSVGRIIQLFDDVAAFRWVADVAEFDLGWNTAAWLFGRGGEPIAGFALAGAIGTAPYPGDIHAFVIQVVFAVVLGGVAFWLFQRRDVAGPAG